MPLSLVHDPAEEVRIRAGTADDLAQLRALESRFVTDRLSARSFRRLAASPQAELMVVELSNEVVGYAAVLFRNNSAVARLYSLAVRADAGGRGLGRTLLAVAEQAAIARDCLWMRLEVREDNAAAIALYRKSGYREFGRRPDYYQDGETALRFEKRLMPEFRRTAAPPYFHQSTDFTCGPACAMMALGWADPSFRPTPALEFRLWREATTIFLSTGPGGCGPYGLAVALRRRGLLPDVHVDRPGPYFLETVRSADQRRVMRLTQDDFRREAEALGVATHLTPVTESVLMRALDDGAAAIVLVSSYDSKGRGQPHWVFVFGRTGRHVLVHDPAAVRDEHGRATSAETHAVPWPVFERMSKVGTEGLRAAIVLRKGR